MPSLATRVAAETLRLLPRKRISRGLGSIASFHAAASLPGGSGLLRQAIDLYVKAYDVDLGEAEIPPGGFDSFDAFFTRALRPGARPVEGGEEILVSPADGRVEDCGPVEPGARVHVKGHDYSLGELLGDPRDGERFEGGTFAVVYLSPRDYHRVHAPVAGAVHTVRHVGGTLLPVNPFGVASYPNLFARNERVAVFQRSEAFGEVVTILVGAIGVGRISLSFDASVMTNVGRGPTTLRYAPERAPTLERGGELGMFHLGSTAIVITNPDHPAALAVQAGEMVRMGRRLALGDAGGDAR
ncbi:MAG: archaetidylserine decarboxylase [Sandaracinaceae bacterium]|nr:MAG: phosphatidylserine decarboxylase [Sandaracinaceae bacterium]HBQ15778.1 phosphatidylserine decarboxylase [Myxococcales bacterium]